VRYTVVCEWFHGPATENARRALFWRATLWLLWQLWSEGVDCLGQWHHQCRSWRMCEGHCWWKDVNVTSLSCTRYRTDSQCVIECWDDEWWSWSRPVMSRAAVLYTRCYGDIVVASPWNDRIKYKVFHMVWVAGHYRVLTLPYLTIRGRRFTA